MQNIKQAKREKKIGNEISNNNRFRKAFASLPEETREHARTSYQQWKKNHDHSALHFKLINKKEAVYSVRVGLSYRALGVKEENTIVWFWIGSHEDYNNLVAQL